MSDLRRVTATRYVTPLREGGSLPGLVEADDLGTYVAKFTGAGQGPKALVAEVVAGEIARRLGLRVPELVVLDVDPVIARAEPDEEVQDLLARSGGPNLGMDFLPGALGFDPVAHRVDPLEASRVLWFDAFVENVDRSWRNPNLLRWHRELWLIDHGACLYFHHSWARAASVVARPYDLDDHVLAPAATARAEADTELAGASTRRCSPTWLALIPDEWLDDVGRPRPTSSTCSPGSRRARRGCRDERARHLRVRACCAWCPTSSAASWSTSACCSTAGTATTSRSGRTSTPTACTPSPRRPTWRRCATRCAAWEGAVRGRGPGRRAVGGRALPLAHRAAQHRPAAGPGAHGADRRPGRGDRAPGRPAGPRAVLNRSVVSPGAPTGDYPDDRSCAAVAGTVARPTATEEDTVADEVRWLETVGSGDVEEVGGKNASLGELIGNLAEVGIRVPGGLRDHGVGLPLVPGGQRSRRADRDRPRRALGRRARARGRRGGDPRALRRRRVPRGHGRGDPVGLRRAGQAPRDRRRRRGRALERHRRGPARRQLRRPAGHLPQHHRGGRAARGLQGLLRVAVHRPRHQLPRRAGLRAHRRRALDRRAEDGALRPRVRRRHVHDRLRHRLPRHRDHQRRLGPRRERRRRRGRPRTSGRSTSRSSTARS